MPSNKPMNQSVNSSIQLALGAIWRHTGSLRSGPVSAVASRLTPIRYAAESVTIGRLLITVLAVFLGCSSEPKLPEYIGEATMRDNGTLILNLVAYDPSGEVGHSSLEYLPGNKDYTRVLQHLGHIEPGKTVPVRPFPDTWADE